ncbi:MAG: arginine--tRNA ligase, partial [Agathobacter sp.]|nr:arginine--tRNA ligase [Agathobacter sp.]
MKKLLDLISEEVTKAFVAGGYDEKYGRVTLSNRPDLCEYQCNGAMAAAKEYKCAPFMISDKIAELLSGNEMFAMVESVKPGFLNLKINENYLANYMNAMQADEDRFGCEKVENPKTIMIDYGGPNVAKPLHVGHLRSAIIGESVKRIGKFVGHNMIGDVHLGDWGLQMGLIITELKLRKPELVYFDEAYEGEYPEEAPFTIAELEEIYPTASGKSKEDEAYKEAALAATNELQQGRRGYRALLAHILNVSVTDLKKNYQKLNVDFELWKGESDAQPYIPDMVAKLKEGGFAYESEGALVVDVAEETDTKEIPPCIILKSDGASLYSTTDLATLVMRMEDYNPESIIYITDKRQELHFKQVFRCAKKTGIVNPETELTHIGFGTMNGKDGKPFKTRDGGVMRLEYLLEEIYEEMLKKILENQKTKENLDISIEEAQDTARKIALAAIKYGDL